MGAEVAFSLAESDFLAGDLRVKINFFQKLLHTGAGAGVVTRFKSEKSKKHDTSRLCRRRRNGGRERRGGPRCFCLRQPDRRWQMTGWSIV